RNAPAHAERAEPAGQELAGELMGARPTLPGPILCVVGARPNYMKMAPLLAAFARPPTLPRAVLVHTGQPSAAAPPRHAIQTGEIMRRFDPVLDRYPPCAVVVVGDVNSTLACSLVAAKR